MVGWLTQGLLSPLFSYGNPWHELTRSHTLLHTLTHTHTHTHTHRLTQHDNVGDALGVARGVGGVLADVAALVRHLDVGDLDGGCVQGGVGEGETPPHGG